MTAWARTNSPSRRNFWRACSACDARASRSPRACCSRPESSDTCGDESPCWIEPGSKRRPANAIRSSERSTTSWCRGFSLLLEPDAALHHARLELPRAVERFIKLVEVPERLAHVLRRHQLADGVRVQPV